MIDSAHVFVCGLMKNRAADMPQQRPSLRGPPNLRTSSSDSDPLHLRARTTDRSPRLVDGRSPRGSQSEPLNQKKLGNRISDLESQLGQAQEELKCLKHQLSSAEAAKKAAQEKLDKKVIKKQRKVPNQAVGIEQETESKNDRSDEYETSEQETDVFEVSVEKEIVEPKTETDPPTNDQDELKPEPIIVSADDELSLLKIKLDERDKELEVTRQENDGIKRQLVEKSVKVASAESGIEGLTLRLSKVDQELEKSKTNAACLNEKLEATEKAKLELENEMKRLRVQTEQWRKAADAAASVLAGEVETNGRRISERCGSMDKHYGSAFEPVRYSGNAGSPGPTDDGDDVFGGGKRRSSGIRMFGDLWRKKGHK